LWEECSSFFQEPPFANYQNHQVTVDFTPIKVTDNSAYIQLINDLKKRVSAAWPDLTAQCPLYEDLCKHPDVVALVNGTQNSFDALDAINAKMLPVWKAICDM